jgi:hypothetical protein
MNKTFLFIASLSLLLVSCGNDNKTGTPENSALSEGRPQYIERIKKLEAEMHKSMQLNDVTAGVAVTAYDNFVKMFPDDSLAPDFLFKAGEITTATKQYPQSLMYYQNITAKYPKYKLVDVSLYMQGVLLDNYLNDDAKAKIIYEEVIAKYPGSSYAMDAKAAINNLGKSDEQLIEEFKKKNGQK